MRLLLYLLLATLLLPACADRGLTSERGTVPLWGRWEQSFTAAAPADAETELTVHVTSPSGKVRAVPGFWDGGRTWRVRFMPDEAGRWQYRSTAQPAVAGLDGQQGSFEIQAVQRAENRFLRHGRIQVSPDGRYFTHRDGTPFFWLSDTAWNGALLSSEEGWEAYLDDRAGKDFTGIQFVTTQWRAGPASAEGEVAYTGYEDIRINPSFFRRLDARIDASNGQGLLAVPVVLWVLGEERQSPGQLPEDQAIRLARYIVARYGAHHVAWFLAGDGRYFGDSAERWKRIGRAVFDTPDHAPVFLHPQGMQWPYEPFEEEPWLSALGYQSGHGDSPETLAWIHSGPPAQAWQEGPPRPVINLEPPYEDHVAYQSKKPHPAYNVRRAAYWSLLNAPTAGVSYGAHGVWSWETEPGEPLNHEGTGIAKPWEEAVDLPGSEDMAHMADLFTSVDWWTLRPNPALVPEQPGSGDPARFVAAAASPGGDLAVLYLPVGEPVEVNLGILKPGLRATWFNPRDGSRRPAERLPQGAFAPPDRLDWVLLLRN